MGDLSDRIQRLNAAQLTEQQLRVLELLEEGLSYQEIADRLHLTKGAVQYHITRIYIKLDIYHLPKGQRHRELGKFAMAAKHLPAQARLYEPSQEGKVDAIETASGYSPPRHIPDQEAESEHEAEEPPAQALAIIQAMAAVMEDERALVVWEKPSTGIRGFVQEVTPRGSSRQEPLRRPSRAYLWLMLLMTFVLGVTTGIGTITLLAGARAPGPGSGSFGEASPPAGNLPAVSTNTVVASLSPQPADPTAAATMAVASVCGETARVTAPDQVRLVRGEGVSVFTVENTKSAVLNNKARALLIGARGLWIGYFVTDQNSTGGVGHYDKATWADCNQGVGEHLADANVNALATDHSGRLWVATEETGVAMYDGASWHRYSTEEGLPSNVTFGLTVDEESNVWVSTMEGVAKYNPNSDGWSSIYTAENRTLAYNSAHVIAFDNAANIWVGHIRNGISRYSKAENRWIHITAQPGGLSGNQVRSIVVQEAATTRPTGGVWIATADGGISRYTGGKWMSYHTADGLPSEDVQALAIDWHGRIWAATMGGVAYFDGEYWIRYHNLPALSIAIGADCATCPFEQNEHVWTGTVSNGLTHSRLPYADQAAIVTEVCFSSQRLARTCQQYPAPTRINGMEVITVTYPDTLAPGETFQSEVFVAPNPPYKLRVGDMLVTTDDPIVFGTYEHIAVQGIVESAQPFKFADYNVPFIAPPLEADEQERTLVSTWRLWMHTRYAGPYIRIVATVRRPSPAPTP